MEQEIKNRTTLAGEAGQEVFDRMRKTAERINLTVKEKIGWKGRILNPELTDRYGKENVFFFEINENTIRIPNSIEGDHEIRFDKEKGEISLSYNEDCGLIDLVKEKDETVEELYNELCPMVEELMPISIRNNAHEGKTIIPSMLDTDLKNPIPTFYFNPERWDIRSALIRQVGSFKEKDIREYENDCKQLLSEIKGVGSFNSKAITKLSSKDAYFFDGKTLVNADRHFNQTAERHIDHRSWNAFSCSAMNYLQLAASNLKQIMFNDSIGTNYIHQETYGGALAAGDCLYPVNGRNSVMIMDGSTGNPVLGVFKSADGRLCIAKDPEDFLAFPFQPQRTEPIELEEQLNNHEDFQEVHKACSKIVDSFKELVLSEDNKEEFRKEMALAFQNGPEAMLNMDNKGRKL